MPRLYWILAADLIHSRKKKRLAKLNSLAAEPNTQYHLTTHPFRADQDGGTS